MFRKIYLIPCLFFVVIFCSDNANALEYVAKHVTVNDNGISKNYFTQAETVKELITLEHIDIDDKDTLNFELSDHLSNGMSIEIKRGLSINVTIDGANEQIYKVKHDACVGNLLAELGNDLVYDGIYSTPLKDNTTVNFCTRKINDEKRKVSIPYQTKIVLDDTLDEGTDKTIQSGVNGQKVICEEITRVGGKETARKFKFEEVTLQPVDKIIHRGTNKKSANAFECRAELRMNASAYTAGYESTGKRPGDAGYGITATGSLAKKGTVAVDPQVIPMGTNLYVEGYGYAKALDKGSAIKGNKIDLFYENLSDAKKFGRRNIKVYVLEQK